jgi:hypothetical protein
MYFFFSKHCGLHKQVLALKQARKKKVNSKRERAREREKNVIIIFKTKSKRDTRNAAKRKAMSSAAARKVEIGRKECGDDDDDAESRSLRRQMKIFHHFLSFVASSCLKLESG